MKNLATSKNDICLIAGSGLFVYEVANYLNNKNLLNQIILINENNHIKKKFKHNYKSFRIKDIDRLLSFMMNDKKKSNQKIMRKDCNHVIRYEKIDEDVDKIFKGLKVPSASVSHPGQWYAEDDSYIMTNKTKNISIGK